MTRLLTKLKIDEISSVDKGAGENCQVLLYKRDGGTARAKSFDEIMKATTAQRMHDKKRRAAQRLADKMAEKEKETQMTRTQEMQEMHKFVKDGGMSAVAKRILETGSTSLNEHEYTALVQEDASLKKISFEKAFADPDTQRAYKIVRDATQAQTYLKTYPNMMSVEPAVVGGDDVDVNDPVKAAADLRELVEQQRKLAPTKTTSELYEAVYSNPANRALIGRAHRRPNVSSPSGDALQR